MHFVLRLHIRIDFEDKIFKVNKVNQEISIS